MSRITRKKLQAGKFLFFGDRTDGASVRRYEKDELIQILASQNVFSNLKLRIANQRVLRDRVLVYLHSLAPDANGFISVPFTRTALAGFLGVNRSALSRGLGRMQDDGLIAVDGEKMKLLRNALAPEAR